METKTVLEAELQKLKDGLALLTASPDALLRAQETSGGSGSARCNDVLSNTRVLSPSVGMSPPDDDCRTEQVDAALKLYRVHGKIIREIRINEAVVRTSLVNHNWKGQVAKTIKGLQGCSGDTTKSQAARRLAPKVKLEAQNNEQQRNISCGKELFPEASASGCLEAVKAEIAPLVPLVEQADTEGQQQSFAQLAKLLAQKCNHLECLNSSVAIPHLRSLYIMLEARNCCSTDERDAHAAAVKEANGPGVTRADE